MGPGDLSDLLSQISEPEDLNLLVGIDGRDDAGVYRISEDLAIVQTVDFFTPVVDDPFDFGQIAVANSLSDIYAMGAKPITALNIIGFPLGSLDKAILHDIIRGGFEKAKEAGVKIIGGHSVKDPELKYGLAVTAVIHPDKIIRNNTAQPGDKIILTKPIGVGILATALKKELLSGEILSLITESMKSLNYLPSVIARKHNATACTDVTGFGLLGHLYEMLLETENSAAIMVSEIPFFPEVLSFSTQKIIPGGLKENRKYLSPHIRNIKKYPDEMINLLCSPETSGGLLFTVSPDNAAECITDLHSNGITSASVIGEIIPDDSSLIFLQ